MSNKEYLLKTQGYYYVVKTFWRTAPEKIFINEYGNKTSAIKARDHWNSLPDCEASIEKRYN